MALGDLIKQTGISLPSGSSIMTGLLGFFLFLIVLGILGFLAFWVVNKMTYNKKIIVFELVGNKYEPTRHDVAKEVVIGDGGERVLYLKKHKAWKMAERQASKGTFWFAICADGYWYNFILGDFNESLGTLETTGISPEMHKIMRYQNAALRKNLRERHIQMKWWQNPAIVGGLSWLLFIVVTGVMFIMIGKDYFGQLPKTLELLNQILERMETIRAALG